MTQTKIPADRTGWIPFILFGIFGAIIIYGIYKGQKKSVKKETEEQVQ